MKRDRYEVLVGNVGMVYRGGSQREALVQFNAYVTASKLDLGRAGGEAVTLFREGDIWQEYEGDWAYREVNSS